MLTAKFASTGEAALIEEIGCLKHVTPFVGQRTLKEIRESILNPNECYLLGVDARQNCLGFAYMVGLQDKNQAVELRQLAVRTSGVGCGSFLLRETRRQVFDVLGKNRLWLDVFPHNATARKLYSKHGFIEEGLLREAYFWGDQFQSTIVMSVLAKDV